MTELNLEFEVENPELPLEMDRIGLSFLKASAKNYSSEWFEELYTKKKAFGGIVSGRKYLLMEHKMLLKKKGVCLIDDHAYATDGAEYVRYCELVKSVAQDETDEK